MTLFSPVFRCILLLVFMVCQFDLNAQSRFVPGYVVKNTGDTIKGLLKPKSLKAGVSGAIFKSNAFGATKEYLPTEINAYGTDTLLFESHKEYLNKGGQVVKKKFFKVIFDGKLDILVGKGNKFFIGTDTTDLVYYLRRKDFLYYLTSDQPALKQEIQEMKFTEKQFVRVMKSYHFSKGINFKVYQPRFASSNIDFYAFAGYNLSSLSARGESDDLVKYSTSYSPTFGYGIDYTPSARFLQTSFSFDLKNRFFKELFQYQHLSQSGSSQTYHDIMYEGFVIEVPVGFKIQRIIGYNLKGYVMPGISCRLIIPAEAKVVQDEVINNEVTTTITDVEYYSRVTIPYSLSAGIELKVKNGGKLHGGLSFDFTQSNEFKRSSLSINFGYKIFSHKFND